MDGLSTLLGMHRGRDAFVLRCEMNPPWSVRIADRSAIGLIVVVRGHCVVTHDGASPVTVVAGDVVIAKGATAYTLADATATVPSVVIEPGQVCRALPDGGTVAPAGGITVRGTRTWGNADAGESAFLTGVYELSEQVSGRLLDHLPDLALLRAPQCDPGLIEVLARELVRDLPGQDLLLDRYVDLLLVCALREWFAQPGAAPPQWWRAQTDPVVGPLLTVLHDRYQEPWTLELLAARVGYSRATVARRFTELVGTPPMSYLTGWRLSIAGDLLLTTDDTIEEIARQVGYLNPFAFSTAFKRMHGRSPRSFRTAASRRSTHDWSATGTM